MWPLSCASAHSRKFGLQGGAPQASEAMTVAEVEATQLRGHCDEGTAELQRLGAALGEKLGAAAEPLTDEERETIETKLARFDRNREQIGPVNPLAEREYEDAREHVTELPSSARTWRRRSPSCGPWSAARTGRSRRPSRRPSRSPPRPRGDGRRAIPGGKGCLRRVDVGPRPFAWQAPEGEEEIQLTRTRRSVAR